MPTTTTLTLPTRVLPDTPPRRTFEPTDVQRKQTSVRVKSSHCEPELLFSPPSTTPSIRLRCQSIANSDVDCDANLIVPPGGEADDEYTISAYGDISLSEVIVPPLPSPTRSRPDVLQQRFPQPRLRLKVRRPPMPKRRLSYAHISAPSPHGEDVESEEDWPGSPRPVANSQSRLQRQPLVSPLLIDATSPQSQGGKPAQNGASSFEKLVDELLLYSPSIRLSPPGSPAQQVHNLPQQKPGRKSVTRRGPSERVDTAVKLTPSVPAPALPQEKPWRTRLPPRPPIPKWDI